MPKKPYEVLVVGSDQKVWHVKEGETPGVKVGVQLSQVSILNSGKYFFTGVGQDGRPGAIQIWRFNGLEKITEVQAHSREVERMRLSLDNKFLFTAGKDGCLMIHSIRQDSKGFQTGGLRDITGHMLTSEEVLTEKVEMEEYMARKEHLSNELAGLKDANSSGVSEKVGANEYEEKIQKLQEELDTNKHVTRNKVEQLETSKQEINDNFDKQIKALAETNHD